MPELLDLLTTSVLAKSTSTMKLVKAAASALFNFSRISLEESIIPGEDEIISIVVALVESLKNSFAQQSTDDKELQRLLVVCLGGFVIFGKQSEAVKEVLAGIEAVDILEKADFSVSKEVIGLLER
jgi:hypothetical protein